MPTKGAVDQLAANKSAIRTRPTAYPTPLLQLLKVAKQKFAAKQICILRYMHETVLPRLDVISLSMPNANN